MGKRQLGSLVSSAVGLGCMGMSGTYGPADDAESIRAIHAAIDAGVTMFDTAEVYGPFSNEILVGRALAGRRSGLVVATKFGRAIDPDGRVTGLDSRPARIKAVADASLSRLGCEVIDLFYQHRVDPAVPVEDVAGAVADLVRDGKVRHFGLCEVSPDTVRRAHAVCPVAAVQTEYSLWERGVEAKLLPVLDELGIGFVAYSPLGRGYLTGQARPAEETPDGNYRRLDPRFAGLSFEANRPILAAIETVARECSLTAAQVALAWVLARSVNIVVIPGAKRVDHAVENARAADATLTASQLAFLSAAAPVGKTAGERYGPDALRTIEAAG